MKGRDRAPPYPIVSKIPQRCFDEFFFFFCLLIFKVQRLTCTWKSIAKWWWRQWRLWCDHNPNSDAQICPHTGQATAAVRFTLLFFLAWRLASRCSSKDLTTDSCTASKQCGFQQELPNQWQGCCRHAWIAWGSLCIVWLDVPVSLCLWLAQNRRVVWEDDF